jgi:formylglycine-generating enzyme required for sulfatase activity
MRLLIFIAMAQGVLMNLIMAQDAPKEIVNSIGMKLVLIPNGVFTRGSPESEKWRGRLETQHEVTISKDYYFGVFEVTQSQYQRVIGANPSHFQGAKFGGSNADYPVEKVSWKDAMLFCEKLSELAAEKKAGRSYRLPTEAEWEYACRAGSKTAYYFNDEPRLLFLNGWFWGNSRSGPNRFERLAEIQSYNADDPFDPELSKASTHPVGQLNPNQWGLYDMHGNVWEWCSDWYGNYPIGAVVDPVGPSEGTRRMLRGGSWIDGYAGCRSAVRCDYDPGKNTYDIGFRVVLDVPTQSH